MNTRDNTELGTAPVGRLLFKLAVPTITAQLINMLYSIIDRIYIGHIPEVGNLALTGIGVCLPIILAISAFASLICAGGAPRASIFMGQGNHKMAEKTMGSCFTLQVIVSIAITVILLIFSRTFLSYFGASEATIEYAVAYMRVYALGTIFVELTLGMNAYITAQGFAKVGMLTVLLGAVTNIILDPVFIFILGLGVQGAALATIISQGLSCIWVIVFLCGKKTYLRLKKDTLKIQWNLVMPCIALGLAPFIMQTSESVISVCFNSSLLVYGGDIAVGAMTILTSVMQFAMLPLQGLSQGAQPISSYNYGARNAERVKKVFILLLTISVIFSTSLWAFLMLFPQLFAEIFTPDPTLVEYTSRALRIYCSVLFVFGIQIACQMTFVSLDQALASIIVACMRKFVLLIPLIYIMPHIMTSDKAMAVYMAEPVADILAVTFTAVLFFYHFRKTLNKLREQKAEVEASKSHMPNTETEGEMAVVHHH